VVIKTSKHVKDQLGIVVERVEVGTQLVTRDAPFNGSLDLENALGGNSPLLPLRDGIGTHANPPSEFGLGQNLEDRVKGTVLHLSNYVHHRLIDVNHQLIAEPKPVVDHKHMVDMPQPEHYSSVAQWIEAARRSRGIPQRAFMEITGRSAQAVNKWFKGKGIDPDSLAKIATWAGVEYASLRLLLDKQPIPTSRRLKGAPPFKTPAAVRIARKLDLLDGDDDSLEMIEDLVDNRLARNAKVRKKA